MKAKLFLQIGFWCWLPHFYKYLFLFFYCIVLTCKSYSCRNYISLLIFVCFVGLRAGVPPPGGPFQHAPPAPPGGHGPPPPGGHGPPPPGGHGLPPPGGHGPPPPGGHGPPPPPTSSAPPPWQTGEDKKGVVNKTLVRFTVMQLQNFSEQKYFKKTFCTFPANFSWQEIESHYTTK